MNEDLETLAEEIIRDVWDDDRHDLWFNATQPPGNRDFGCACSPEPLGHIPEDDYEAIERAHRTDLVRARLAPLLDQARRDAAEKARQDADAVKDREFGNLRWMDGHAQGLKDGRAEALAPVLALADEWEAERDAPFGEAHMSYGYAQHELRRAVASHQEGGAVVSRDGEVCCSNPASCSGIAGPGTEGCVRDQEGGA